MKRYSVTAAAILTALACTQSHAQTVDTTAPVFETEPQVAAVQYVQTPMGSTVSTDTKYAPNLQVKPVVLKGKQEVQKPAVPVRIDADKMYYNDTTGRVWANGSVEVERGNQQLLSQKIEGNTKTQQYESASDYRFLEDKGDTKDLTGSHITYNATTGEAHTKDVFGYADPYWVKAEVGDFDGKTGRIEKGWLTTKHAIAFKGAPDYRVEGDYIEVFPGDKAVIHNASFYIKNKRIISVKKYTVSLRQDKQGQVSVFSFVPRPKYNSSDGLSLTGKIDYPVSKHGELFLHYTWGTNIGFKPSFGYVQFLPWGEAKIAYSRESATLNAKKVWVEKKPELSIDTHAYHIGTTPFTIRGGASYGRWVEGHIKGSHTKYFGELSHDPVHIGPKTEVKFYGGYQRDYYGYDSSVRSMPYWGVGATTKLGPRVDAWAGYRQSNVSVSADSPYPFDQIDVKYNLYYGLSVQATRLDRFSVQMQRDMQTHELRYVDLTWHRDLHSFEGSLTYRTKQKKWEYTLVAKDF